MAISRSVSGCCGYKHRSHPFLLTTSHPPADHPHPSPLTPHPSPLTPHPSPLRDLESEKLVAIKLIPRGAPAWQLAMVEHEISIMLELGAQHPNIVNPRELVLTPSHLGLVQEYMSGGTLADYLKSHKADEALACYFFRQIIAAVEYCHKHRVAWRDIKLENTLLDRSSPPRVVACDFGNSKQWAKKSMPVMYSITGAQQTLWLAPPLQAVPRGMAHCALMYTSSLPHLNAATATTHRCSITGGPRSSRSTPHAHQQRLSRHATMLTTAPCCPPLQAHPATSAQRSWRQPSMRPPLRMMPPRVTCGPAACCCASCSCTTSLTTSTTW
jgi:serine/threonine protein kinase